MLFGHYSKKEVNQIVQYKLKDYEAKIKALTARQGELLEENRRLSARLSSLESRESDISAALLSSVEAGRKNEEKAAAYVENQLRGVRLVAEKSKRLVEDLKKKHPEEDDYGELSEFFTRLEDILSDDDGDFAAESAETDIDIDSICKELGIVDDGTGNNREFVFFEDDEN